MPAEAGLEPLGQGRDRQARGETARRGERPPGEGGDRQERGYFRSDTKRPTRKSAQRRREHGRAAARSDSRFRVALHQVLATDAAPAPPPRRPTDNAVSSFCPRTTTQPGGALPSSASLIRLPHRLCRSAAASRSSASMFADALMKLSSSTATLTCAAAAGRGA